MVSSRPERESYKCLYIILQKRRRKMRMIDEIKFLFEQRGYNLLSTEYLNNKQYLVFEKNGYKYYNTYNGFIKSGNFKKWSSKNPCTKKISSLELKTKEWLEENNIKYIPQKIFEECKDINLLRFDFYLPDYDSVIEVDGSQHYFPVNFNGDMDKAKENFEKNKKHDIIKDDFCKKYNIKILRLPYFDFDKNDTYKEKLQTFIS